MMYLKICLIFCLMNIVFCNRRISVKQLENLRLKISKAQDDLSSKNFSTKLSKIIDKLPSSSDERGESVLEFYACNICVTSIDEFLHLRRVELLNDTYLIELAIELCTAFEIQEEQVCRGVVELYAPSIIYIVDKRPELSAETVCKFLLNDGDCSNPYNDDNLEFTVEMNEYNHHKNVAETPEILSTNSSSADDIIIVHITDIHVDMKYKKGALANCKKYACCRDINITPEMENSSHLSGYWGDYNSCDTPIHAVEDAFNHIVKQHPKIDAIYFTGDIVDHFIWDTTIDSIKNSLSIIYGLMKSVFKDIPVYPIIGNHETQNLFAPLHIEPSLLSTTWLYNHFVENWPDILTNDSIETFKNGGYYTYLVKPGLRLIALNNNLCYLFNFWILYDVEQIRAQFQWLHDTLLNAEQAREKVHILAHIPNGLDEYHEPCSREYHRIIERFKNTIVAQFNGHVESYGFHLFYESANISNPASIAFNGGSLASFSKVNRNYVVYIVNPETFEVKEADVWTYNLTDANQKQDFEKPQWFKQPSLREKFNLPDLSSTTMSVFVMEMMKNPSIFKQFWQMKIKNSDVLLKDGCDEACYKDTICEIIISDNTNNSLCKNVKNLNNEAASNSRK